MRYLILFAMLISWLSAATSYFSLHQKPDFYNKKVGFKEQWLTNDRNRLIVNHTEYAYKGDQIICKENDSSLCKKKPNNIHTTKWCAPHWYRYRIYLLKGTKVSIRIGATRNTTLSALYYFVPDGSELQEVNLNNFKVAYYPNTYNSRYYYVDFVNKKDSDNYLFQGYNVLYKKFPIADFIKFDTIPKSGWLYVNLNQSTQIEPSYQGYVSSAKPYLNVEYTNIPKDLQSREAMISNIHFDSNGDPIENFSKLKEIQKSCYGEKIIEIHGTGDMGPVLKSEASLKDEIIIYKIDFFSGNKVVYGIESRSTDQEINHNITISAKIDDCLQFVSAQNFNERGEFFYSRDGHSWRENPTADDTFVKYELSSPDSSEVVLSPQESLKIVLNTKVSDTCSKTTSYFSVRYKTNTIEEQNISKTIMVYSLTRDEDADAIAYCQRLGGEPVLDDQGHYKGCNYSKSSQSSSSDSSSSSSQSNAVQSSSSQSTDAESIAYCQRLGGKPVLDDQGHYQGCDFSKSSQSSSSSHSSSSSSLSSTIQSSSAQNADVSDGSRLSEILHKLAKRSFPVKGYFIHYDKNDTFGWAYKSRGKVFAKLEGMDPQTGHLKWTFLQDYFPNVKYDDENETIVVGDINATDVSDGSRLSEILHKLAKRSFPVKGYFIHYDKNDTFGWAYKSRGKVFAKLEGMDPQTGHLKWTFLQDYFPNVKYDDENETIVVGDINATDISE